MHMVDSRNLSSWMLLPYAPLYIYIGFGCWMSRHHGVHRQMSTLANGHTSSASDLAIFAQGAPFTDLIDFNEAFTSGRASFHRRCVKRPNQKRCQIYGKPDQRKDNCVQRARMTPLAEYPRILSQQCIEIVRSDSRLGDFEFGGEHLAWPLRICRELSLVMRDVEMTKLLAKEAASHQYHPEYLHHRAVNLRWWQMSMVSRYQ